MESYEAMKACIGGLAKAVAKRLRSSDQLIYKWMQPTHDYSESGALNPLDRLEAVIAEALSHGTPRDKALMPVKWLASRFNLVVIEVPESGNCEFGATKAMLDTVKEFGELAAVASEALGDGTISRSERRDLMREGREAQEALAGFLRIVEQECPIEHAVRQK